MGNNGGAAAQGGRELLVLLSRSFSLATNEAASLVSLCHTQAFEICLEA